MRASSIVSPRSSPAMHKGPLAAKPRLSFSMQIRVTCSPLPDGRVGAQIAGWTRPVRDDVLAKHAHGTIDMHDGIVHSCNAYFGQLAVRLGPGPILETASRLGISVTPSNSVQGVRGTLPQAGYGQGDVVATPIRMARVAAAIASGGVLRDAR